MPLMMRGHGAKKRQSEYRCQRRWSDGMADSAWLRLDVYVWDYLTRRGFSRTAKSLMNEAGMTEAPGVPLQTPQGLLFECVACSLGVLVLH